MTNKTYDDGNSIKKGGLSSKNESLKVKTINAPELYGDNSIAK